jgi:hypothetical protein
MMTSEETPEGGARGECRANKMRSDRITAEEAAEEPQTTEAVKTLPVYQAITEHQRGAEWWAYHDDLVKLRDWGLKLIKEFAIKVKDGEYLSPPLIKIEPMNIRTFGTYRIEADGYAIKGAIVLNSKRLPGLDDHMKLGLLMKLLLDAWEQQRCRDDLFAEQCRKGFQKFGLTVTEDGITIEKGGRFREWLGRNGIEPPAGEIPWPEPKQEGRSTNKLWSCLCQRVRVGTSDFEAICPRCQTEFQPGDHVMFHWSRAASAVRTAH